ncbi:N-acetyltransferase, partial [Nocardia cyriacigeorgica]|uniref:N-acetyltransferase n=1 Tax=Nocardia cyriacigeorgica TaxID=135487 RepID=UPI002458DA93
NILYLSFAHTEIYTQFAGLGFGRVLVDPALNHPRAHHLGALPMCPMVRHFVETRPEYLPMVPHWARGRLGLPQ